MQSNNQENSAFYLLYNPSAVDVSLSPYTFFFTGNKVAILITGNKVAILSSGMHR